MAEKDNPHRPALQEAIAAIGSEPILRQKLNERGWSIKSRNVIAQWLAWQAKFPDRVPHRRLLPPAGEFSAINPVVAAGGEPCVDLALDTLDSPALIAQVLTAAGVLSEGLASPALINEDLC